MIDTLIIHGSFGSPLENWFPWLAQQLSKTGRRVLVPHFPDRDLQNLENWSAVLDSYRPFFSDRLTIYAHSLGPAFVVDFVVDKGLVLEKAIFVSPFYGLISIEEFDAVNQSFFVDEDYLRKFASLCRNCTCVFSDDDPYVPEELSVKFCELVNGKKEIVPGGKHLNSSAGFSEFPLLLDI
jgi:predicted alpha/beta hydrolase family esterase